MLYQPGTFSNFFIHIAKDEGCNSLILRGINSPSLSFSTQTVLHFFSMPSIALGASGLSASVPYGCPDQSLMESASWTWSAHTVLVWGFGPAPWAPSLGVRKIAWVSVKCLGVSRSNRKPLCLWPISCQFYHFWRKGTYKDGGFASWSIYKK